MRYPRPVRGTRSERLVWLAPPLVDRLTAMRGPSESHSDVVLRLIELEAKGR
jgi:hypothetical protein